MVKVGGMRRNADRYTVKVVHRNDLPQTLAAASELGLHWTVQGDAGTMAMVYLFLDEAGMLNYLSFVYGDVADAIRAELEQFYTSFGDDSRADDAAALETLKRIGDLL